MAGAPMLEVAGLNAFYGWAHILCDLSLSVGRGEVVVLLGRNGAGKSTTLKSIVGLVRPASGTIALEGAAIAGMPPYRIARRGLGYVPEDRRIFTDLTIRGLKANGLSVLLSEQNPRFARMVCDRAYIIEKGRIRWAGAMDDLAADEDAKQYLSV